jgi:hypothetical protein
MDGGTPDIERRVAMKTRAVLLGALSHLLIGWGASARADVQPPGTPLGGPFVGAVDLVEGLTVLPGPVQEGDLVLLENPTGNNVPSNWSDVVRFFNVTTPLGVMGFAFSVPDNENGVFNLAINTNVGRSLPNALSGNVLTTTEVQFGTGTDVDLTSYQVTGASYRVHSGAANPEPTPGPPTIDPGAPIPGPGVVPNQVVVIVEVGIGGGAALPFPGQPGGPIQINEDNTIGNNGVFSDTLTFTPTSVSLSSDPPDQFDQDRLTDVEFFNAFNGGPGDENAIAGYVILSGDVPEPASLTLMGIGACVMAGCTWRRNRVA